MSLSPQTIKIIKATAPVLAEHGYTITSTMYGRMLPNNPKVQELFNPTHQVKLPGDSVARQPLALAQSVLAYAQNIDNLGALGPAVERIAHKHVALHILPEHYPVVGENLLWAIKKVLGDAATPEIMAAWTEGYQVLADIFIDRERELREGQGALPGGWEGWREFVVVKKVPESSDTTSFHLKPKDGQGILSFLPGQYIGLRVDLPNGMTTQRNYSLSNAPNMGEYRITVKREGPANTGCPMGKVSSYLHDDIKEGDVLNLTVPSGDFFLDIKHDKPIVLLSGGVGITPMASMANFLATKNLPNHVTMINCNRCPQSAALGAELLGLTGGRDNFKVKTVFDSSNLGDAKGFLTKDVLKSYIGNAAADAHYYFCGPPAFMVNVRHILGELGVPAEQVHYEFFGPHDST